MRREEGGKSRRKKERRNKEEKEVEGKGKKGGLAFIMLGPLTLYAQHPNFSSHTEPYGIWVLTFVLVSRFRGNQEEAHLSEFLTYQGEKEVTRGKRGSWGRKRTWNFKFQDLCPVLAIVTFWDLSLPFSLFCMGKAISFQGVW